MGRQEVYRTGKVWSVQRYQHEVVKQLRLAASCASDRVVLRGSVVRAAHNKTRRGRARKLAGLLHGEGEH
jgi:hypothetical protein